MYKTTSLTIFLILLSFSLSAQELENQSFKKAKLYLDNHKILVVRDVTIASGQASYTNSENGQPATISTSSIQAIKEPAGTHMLEGALGGASTLALTALMIDLQPDPLGIERDHDAGFYLTWTASGFLLGGLVGMFFPKWKAAYPIQSLN